MITEDELRARLHAESASLTPRGDLVESLAEGHAHRHRRARIGLVGGSIAATALIVTLLGGLFTSGQPVPITSASPGEAEIIEQARQADAAGRSMILHIKATHSGGGALDGGFESWVLRSETLGRVIVNWNGSDTVVKPDGQETIFFGDRTFDTSPERIDDAASRVSGSGIGDISLWLKEPGLRVRTDQTGTHLVVQRGSIKMDMLLDSKTYMPVGATFGQYDMKFDWLPATAENRKLLEHTVPPDFTKKTDSKITFPPATK
jgi:hypothetical protein